MNFNIYISIFKKRLRLSTVANSKQFHLLKKILERSALVGKISDDQFSKLIAEKETIFNDCRSVLNCEELKPYLKSANEANFFSFDRA